jgi:hypothetical protein
MRRNLLRFGLIFVIFHNNFISHLNGAFSNHFRAFLHNRFGQEMVGQLERRDLGDDASVGGLEDGAQQVPVPTSGNDPVIIVHGITNKITRFAVRY